MRQRFAANGQTLERIWETVENFATEVDRAGGTTYLVGGAVRDLLLGLTPKDIDLEIHGLVPAKVEDLATRFGHLVSVGRSFGVLKVRVDDHEIDLSLPRRETKTGSGHRDFSIGIDPMMDVPTAARRRDFSIGAIYLRVTTGELVDPYGGISDLNNRLLKMIDAKGFTEDPLRVLRAMQLAARFNLSVDPETMNAMREIVPSMGALSADRVREEWKKILLSSHPTRGLELGRQNGYIEQWHPELAALWATPQDPKTHPEGSVWNHTLLALDAAGRVQSFKQFTEPQRLFVMAAILTHDFGKASTTRNVEGVFRDDSHAQAGTRPARSFLDRLGFPEKFINHVLPLVALHGRPHQIFHLAQQGQEPQIGELRRMVRTLAPATLDELLVVTVADQLGRGPFSRPDGLVAMPERYDGYDWWQKKISAEKLNAPFEPILSGRDLIQRGWAAGRQIGEVVHYADQLGLNGMSRTEILQILDTIKTPAETAATLRSLVQAEVG